VILLVLLAAVWVVVLTPSVWRRIKERGGVVSIDHFHHQLELLEHAGPKIVTPAYRLHVDGTERPLDVASARPKLVLLRPVADRQSADIDDVDGAHYARVGVIQSPEPSLCPAQTETELAAYRRLQARHRCTFILRLLALVAVSTAILGAMPSMHLAWIATAITAIAAFALVGLIAYAREMEGQRRPRRRPDVQFVAEQSYAEPPRAAPSYAAPITDDAFWEDEAVPRGAAQAGFPGAWDEEEQWEEEPLRRASAGH
jgi:hypothetical protein